LIPLPNLHTQRLLLRSLTSTDQLRLTELANDPDVARQLKNLDYPYSQQDAAEWLASLAPEWEAEQSAVFGICLKSDQGSQLVGVAGFVFDGRSNRAELGYWLGKDYWGQGVCTEAVVALLDFAFGQMGLHRVTAECLVGNPRSVAVLNKTGFSKEGCFRQHFRKEADLDYQDVLTFGLLKEDWNRRNR